ncbi:NAD-dependent protein deacylase [Clostridiaceae bacterium M8S5]|nr:NAD-dependent protein deacylase [Clostridiaceae bacterium M8S5]
MSIRELKNMIDRSKNIVFFGGAGTSTESNIPDFRSEEGLYSQQYKYKYPPEIMLSHSFFKNHTKEFYDFYINKMIFKDAKANKCHEALVKLEELGKLKAIITQNIDGLHQLAGSKNVIELHGSIHKNYCMSCGDFYSLDYILKNKHSVPRCEKCQGLIKPKVTLYEEELDQKMLYKAIDYISNADMLIVAGTSLVVYPAAGLINYYNKDKLVLINKESTPYDSHADIVINESIGSVLEKVI